ncbi:hypothetical protein N7457_007253 [Penicillium paradoxum]|uniref:uncharacterized protein n=1 Tax=Penicillium paradoxum TaxID=176176 RepID=UPI00254743B8|nr:uncharacterized protein N7457_007253 [Penicillium paradoxum]KAJ5779533.1 hypothetical protein N7457_007253 [Penicillium paradoxum]
MEHKNVDRPMQPITCQTKVIIASVANRSGWICSGQLPLLAKMNNKALALTPPRPSRLAKLTFDNPVIGPRPLFGE